MNNHNHHNSNNNQRQSDNGGGDNNNNNAPPVVECRGLCKSYPAGGGGLQVVLSDAALKVSPGEAVMICGASGSGKTTLLHLLGGLDKADSGEVEVCGRRLFDMPPRELAKLRNRRMGFVFQFHLLLPEFSAVENAAMPLLIRGGGSRAESFAKARQLLDDLALAGVADKRPASLSGGERQRVAVARALIGGADCIFADEPTGNLDRKNADAVFDMLLAQCRLRKMALITATHDSYLLARADRCLELRDGKLWHKT